MRFHCISYPLKCKSSIYGCGARMVKYVPKVGDQCRFLHITGVYTLGAITE